MCSITCSITWRLSVCVLPLQDFAQFIIIAVLAGLFWLRKGPNSTVAGAQQVIGLLFFELLFLGFRALFVALFTFPDEYKMVRMHTLSVITRLKFACNQSEPRFCSPREPSRGLERWRGTAL